ncbi:MAG: phenylalanine--tRNA ligase subunit beta [Pseudomonadota bacterium]
MKFSEQWLREWVSPAVTTTELCDQLTMAGLEVDAVTPVAPAFDKVVVGEVLEVAPHPDAERLKVCRVNVGAAEPLQIVCGAANVRVGLRVPAALAGARLPGGLEIKKAKLRGVESCGMLCSAKELGLAESSNGLMVLPADAAPGADVRAWLRLDDVTIELGVTPNRGDCLSVAGIAREVAALNRSTISSPQAVEVPAAIADVLCIEIAAPEACPRYIGRAITGINRAAETPLWMRERLRRSGVRSIHPVVDVTNYVLLELGQPMHAFDLNKLVGGIRVRYAQTGETITLLDSQQVTLEAGTLLICDHKQPQAIAGIMGGLDAAIGDTTDSLFLESAFFAPQVISGHARRYGLHTDSSHRFERGVDPELPRRAMERTTALLLEIAGGQAGPVVEAADEAHLPARKPIVLRMARVKRLLGADIPSTRIEEDLERLGMDVTIQAEGWRVTPPGFRFDIAIEADLIEEIGRIYGYSALPASRPQGELTISTQPEARVDLGRIRQVLVDRGYQEAITYSFVDPALQRLLDPQTHPLPLANPISADMAVMRTTLWPGLMQALMYNQNRQQTRARLFESGVKFISQDDEIKEEKLISGVISGDLYPEQWGQPSRPVDFYDAKADVEALLALTAQPGDFVFTPQQHPALHPGQSALIRRRDGETVGWVGALHPAIERELGLTDRALLFELRLAVIVQAKLPRFRELSKYPAIRRDIAVIVDDAVSSQAVRECIANTAGELLQNLQLFDVYRGKGIEPGRKSLALGLTWQDVSRTLTDQDIDALMERVVGKLQSDLGAKLRD